MAKQVATQIKLQAPGGQATPAPPIGPALGQHGVNIGQFVQQFNSQTANLNGMTVPVVITVYTDKSFTFEVKSPPAAVLLKEKAQIASLYRSGADCNGDIDRGLFFLSRSETTFPVPAGYCRAFRCPDYP